MNAQIWSWVLTFIGVSGFYLAGRKIWWAWYINIANQTIWAAYAVVTHQWGFLAGIPVYLLVFIPNAIRWTKERNHSLTDNKVRQVSTADWNNIPPLTLKRNDVKSQENQG
jgi:hypothetical protein